MHSNQTYNQTYMQYIYISRKREREREIGKLNVFCR